MPCTHRERVCDALVLIVARHPALIEHQTRREGAVALAARGRGGVPRKGRRGVRSSAVGPGAGPLQHRGEVGGRLRVALERRLAEEAHGGAAVLGEPLAVEVQQGKEVLCVCVRRIVSG